MQVQVLSSAPSNGSRSKNAFDLLFFTSTAMSCSDSRAKYSQGQRGRSPTGAAGSARADAHDSGSCGKPCRFKSCHPHQTRIKRTREKILSSFCFLQEIISDLKSNDKYITTFNRVFQTLGFSMSFCRPIIAFRLRL